MKTPKHTPGPWSVEAVNSEAMHDICLGYRVPGAGHPILIASVYGDDEPRRPGDISVFEAEANARLIASAPDLLRQRDALRAALLDCLAWMSCHCGGTACLPCRHSRAAEAALALCPPPPPQE